MILKPAPSVAPLENLSSINFLSVCDIVMDIMEKLQVITHSEVILPVLKNPVLFKILCPAQTPDLVTNYCNYRLQALGYLKEVDVLNFTLENDEHEGLWRAHVVVNVKRQAFDDYYKKLTDVYQKRVVDPQNKQAAGQDNSVLKITDFKFNENNEIIFRNLKSQLPNNTNQSEMCKYLFAQTSIGEWVSWDKVYQEIQGAPMENKKRVIYDAAEAVNEKTLKDIGLKILETKTGQIRINPRFL